MNKYLFSRRVTAASLFFCISVPLGVKAKEVQLSGDQSSYEEQKPHERIECELIPIPSRSSKVRSHINIPGPFDSFYKSLNSVTQSSTNWCGYVAVSDVSKPAANTVSRVAGSWVVPSIVASQNDTYCAIWIGIDGFASSTVEQIGTGHDCVGGIIEHYAWFEMYPGASYAINGFPVQVGDSISTVVSYSHDGIFTMTIYNNTRNVSYTVPVVNTTLASAQRSSAEWIVEAPWWNGILPLSNFGTAHLTNCTATITGFGSGTGTGGCGGSGSGSGSPIGSLPNIEMIMVDSAGNLKAVPTALLADQKSFDVAWKHQ